VTQKNLHKIYDVAILGSGIASLTSAALLSKKGLRVIVLEQHSKPGGYLHCFNRFGTRFDTGAHYVGALGNGQPFHTLLSYLDVYEDSLFVRLDEKFDVFQFQDFSVEMPIGYEQTIQTLSQKFPDDAKAIQAFYALTREAIQHFPTYEFNDESVDVQSLVKVVEESLAHVVNRLTQNDRLKAVFYAYCSLHGVMPEDVPFGFHSIMTDSLIRGPYGFAKGGDGLAQKFVEIIKRNGGEVLTKTAVTQIETEGKLAKAFVTSDGSRIEAKWFISSAHPKITFELIDNPQIFSPAFRERVKNLKESLGIFGIYGLHSSQNDFHPLRNYYYFSSTDPKLMLGSKDPSQKPDAIFLCPSERKFQSEGTPFPMSIHSVAPFEWFSEFKDSRFGKRDPSYSERKSIYAEKVLERIEDFGIPMRERFSKFVSSSPLTNLHFNGSVEGSSYGIYHSIQNIGPRAIGPRTHVANLLLTGQSTLFPGILGAAISGLRTAGHIIGIKAILKELKEKRMSENA
jgi:all-trans-retinol 13,14-reductase